MTIANISEGNAHCLPQALRTAQDAMHLPEVQDMLRRLSKYQLGIFMPHMHDEATGQFQTLPEEVMQVESGMAVTFQSTGAIAGQMDRFLPVGWVWRDGTAKACSACEMAPDETPGDEVRSGKHTMVQRT